PHVEGRPRRGRAPAAARLSARQQVLAAHRTPARPAIPAPHGAGIAGQAQSPPCAATAASTSAADARNVTLSPCSAICCLGNEAGPLASSTTTMSSAVISLTLPSSTLSAL